MLVFLVLRQIMQKYYLFLIVHFMFVFLFSLSEIFAHALFDDLLVIICHASFISVLCLCVHFSCSSGEYSRFFFAFVKIRFFPINHKPEKFEFNFSGLHNNRSVMFTEEYEQLERIRILDRIYFYHE